MSDFAKIGAHPALRRALATQGYSIPTPVQALVLSPQLAGRDLLVSSRTGSGKTVAFGLLLGEALLGELTGLGPSGPPLGLVVAPTRELALQVGRELSWLLAEAMGRVVTCVGGMDPCREARALSAGAHVVVGTPGRLLDHLDRKNLDLGNVAVLVLDEADEMLDMGFREELVALLSAAPAERRTVLFSATLPKPILELAKRFTRDPARVAATPPEEAHGDITFRAHLVAEREREHAIVNVLRRIEPDRALVFRATREAAHHTGASLAERGFEAVVLSGELTQEERLRALKALRDGRAKVLVATDVAARGLDLPGIELGAPRRPAPGHRGPATPQRPDRARREEGLAVLLSSPAERFRLEKLLRSARIRAEWTKLPTPEEIRALDDDRLKEDVAKLAGEASEEELSVARRLLDERAPLLIAAALVKRERGRKPAPEELLETARAEKEVPVAASRLPKKLKSHQRTQGVWFRLNLGRDKKGDPRWILRSSAGAARSPATPSARSWCWRRRPASRFAGPAAEGFARAARRPDPRMPGSRIEPSQKP